jgi:hypothetical protein
MKHYKVVMAFVIIIIAIALIGAFYASFPAPPGNACPESTGINYGYDQTLKDHTDLQLTFPISNSLTTSGAGLVTPGCLLEQDSLTMVADGPRTNYSFSIVQFVPEQQTMTNVTDGTVTEVTVETDVLSQTVSFFAYPWYHNELPITLDSSSTTRTVVLGILGNDTNATWTFQHSTPASELPYGGSNGSVYEFVLTLLIIVVATVLVIAFIVKHHVQKVGGIGSNMRLPFGVMTGVTLMLLGLIAANWNGVLYAIGSYKSYLLIIFPLSFWCYLIFVKLFKDPAKVVGSERHEPDVMSKYASELDRDN